MNGYFEQFKKDFKRDVLAQTVVGLKHSKVSKEGAAELAKQVIYATESAQDVEVFARLSKVAEFHPEILNAFIKHGNQYDAREAQEQIKEIRGYLDVLKEISKGGGN